MSRKRLNQVIEQIATGLTDGTYITMAEVPEDLKNEFKLLNDQCPPQKDVDLTTLDKLMALEIEEYERTGETAEELHAAFKEMRTDITTSYKSLEALMSDLNTFIAARKTL